MSSDDFERMKEAEKGHLRKLKELKQTLAGLRRTQSSRQALDDMASGRQQALDTHDEFMDRITREAATTEARMEIALESERERQQAQSLEQVEEALRKARAAEMVRQMRGELSGERPAAAPLAPSEETGSREPSEKTIGRPIAEAEQGSGTDKEPAEKPGKTIGRMRP